MVKVLPNETSKNILNYFVRNKANKSITTLNRPSVRSSANHFKDMLYRPSAFDNKNIEEALYVLRNIEARSCNSCYSGKALGVTQPECVFVTECYSLRRNGVCMSERVTAATTPRHQHLVI
jgi:hypothetical protein